MMIRNCVGVEKSDNFFPRRMFRMEIMRRDRKCRKQNYRSTYTYPVAVLNGIRKPILNFYFDSERAKERFPIVLNFKEIENYRW